MVFYSKEVGKIQNVESDEIYFMHCVLNCNTVAGLYEGGAAALSGKRCRSGVYTSGTAVCAAQMAFNFRQSSGTVPL